MALIIHFCATMRNELRFWTKWFLSICWSFNMLWQCCQMYRLILKVVYWMIGFTKSCILLNMKLCTHEKKFWRKNQSSSIFLVNLGNPQHQKNPIYWMDHIPERFIQQKKANPSHQDLRSQLPSTWMHIIIGHRTKGTLLLVMWCGPWAATGPRFCGSPATKGSLSLCSVGKCFFLCSKSSSWGPFLVVGAFWWWFLGPRTLMVARTHNNQAQITFLAQPARFCCSPAAASWVISSTERCYTQCQNLRSK